MHEVACIFHILVGVVIKRIRVHHTVIRTIETLHTRMQQFRSCHVFSISALDGGQLLYFHSSGFLILMLLMVTAFTFFVNMNSPVTVKGKDTGT